jgi:hypothetical protein
MSLQNLLGEKAVFRLRKTHATGEPLIVEG